MFVSGLTNCSIVTSKTTSSTSFLIIPLGCSVIVYFSNDHEQYWVLNNDEYFANSSKNHKNPVERLYWILFSFSRTHWKDDFTGIIMILSRGKSWQKKQDYHNVLFKFGFKINGQRFDFLWKSKKEWIVMLVTSWRWRLKVDDNFCMSGSDDIAE